MDPDEIVRFLRSNYLLFTKVCICLSKKPTGKSERGLDEKRDTQKKKQNEAKGHSLMKSVRGTVRQIPSMLLS